MPALRNETLIQTGGGLRGGLSITALTFPNGRISENRPCCLRVPSEDFTGSLHAGSPQEGRVISARLYIDMLSNAATALPGAASAELAATCQSVDLRIVLPNVSAL